MSGVDGELRAKPLTDLDRSLIVLCQTQPGLVRTLRVLYGHIDTDQPSRNELFCLARILHLLGDDLSAKANAPLSPA